MEAKEYLNDPPYPTDWQQVTSMSGETGWLDRDYLSPTENEATSPKAADQEVWKLFEKWMFISNRADPTQEASLYSDPSEFLDHGNISRQQLEEELRKDLQRWPTQFNRVSSGPVVEKVNDSEWRVTFEIRFDVRNPSQMKRVTGNANLTWTVRKRAGGSGMEITSSKEQVTSRTYHDVQRTR